MTAPNASDPAAADPGTDTADVADEETQSNPRKTAIEWTLIIAAALLAALLIKTFAIQAFYIPSESMDPTLKVKDRVLVNKVRYSIDRGDIIVFKRPPNETGTDPSIKDLIKRVVALPGEKIEGRENRIFINDQELNEPYLPEGTTFLNFAPQVVPPDHYFMMGDNRPSSRDSRSFGPIHKDLVVGKSFIRVWPPHKLRLM